MWAIRAKDYPQQISTASFTYPQVIHRCLHTRMSITSATELTFPQETCEPYNKDKYV